MGGLAQALVAVARAAVADCEGGALVEAALAGRAGAPFVVGAGKAVGAMAAGAARALGDRFRCGPLVGKHPEPAADPLRACMRVAGHPLPDERSVRATADLIDFVAARRADEEVIFLLSGGASALIGGPVDGVPLDDLRDATRALLGSGLPIGAINAVRRHVGRALGGRLALATPASIEVLALSDVVGDDPATIGSGPASGDPSRFVEALAVVEGIGLANAVTELLRRGARGDEMETPKPGDPRLARVRHRVLATPVRLRDRAAARAREAGLRPVVEPALVESDVAELARRYAERARSLAPGEVVVAVGEPTLIVRGGGRGGRSQQLALEVARRIAGTPAAFVALGSDGSDGPTDAAGAAVDGATESAAARAGMDLARAIADNDAYPALAALGALVVTGATGTNLLDLHLLSLTPASR